MAVVGLVLEAFVDIVGGFDAPSAFAAFATAVDTLSFFSSAGKKCSKS